MLKSNNCEVCVSEIPGQNQWDSGQTTVGFGTLTQSVESTDKTFAVCMLRSFVYT